jgi:hypothetical protein
MAPTGAPTRLVTDDDARPSEACLNRLAATNRTSLGANRRDSRIAACKPAVTFERTNLIGKWTSGSLLNLVSGLNAYSWHFCDIARLSNEARLSPASGRSRDSVVLLGRPAWDGY